MLPARALDGDGSPVAIQHMQPRLCAEMANFGHGETKLLAIASTTASCSGSTANKIS